MSLLLLLLLLLLLSLFSGVSAEVPLTRTHVTSLPGFNGALPSRLETGFVRQKFFAIMFYLTMTRYVTVDEENGAELFYYFFESEGDPGSDPVLLWLTGGDRCSVLSALFFEIGPLKLVIEPYNGSLPRLHYHPYSWTKVASILFVDSPVGAGFSFSRDPKGYDVGDVSASLQLVKFLSNGYVVDNPTTGERIDYESKVPYLHGVGIISDQLYETIMERCKGEDHNNPKNVICKQALTRFNDLLNEVSKPHILYKKCIYMSLIPKFESMDRKILKEELGILKHRPPRPSIQCVSYSNYLSYFWANDNVTREYLGIKKIHRLTPSRIQSKIARMLNNVIVKLGDHDTVLPFLGTQTWVRSLNYPIVDDWRAWHVDGQSAGFTVAYGNNLTFATVKVTQLKPHKVDVKTVDSLKIALGYVTLSTVNNQDSTDLGWTITAKPSIILMNEMVTEITY
ncbi:Os11g0431400 [Oryza sativa Japonica Group]|uniref:Os11g0431400 protein n=1 Tax=Oryza sativa subsp. japonica TaxID=39947 RepID=Q0IT11_ORYSJ|nr:Os11g0431400 [Oryza sativa Japonica Group]|eukprot:NP_001067791.2 Os11g0431400 [Oryza sativa Japonica Group]